MRRERLRRGWTFRDLSERCAQAGAPIGFGQLARIERGMWTPRPKNRAVLAEVLGLDVGDFDLSADRAKDTAAAGDAAL